MPRQLKHPSVRRRTNVASTHAVLHILSPDEINIPPLPTLFDKDGNEKPWNENALRWWSTIWSSPMAPEFHKSDIEGLYRLAVVVNAFWGGRLDLLSEIRLYEDKFGLNPLARRRLEWQIEDTEEKQAAGAKRRAAAAPKPSVRAAGGAAYSALT